MILTFSISSQRYSGRVKLRTINDGVRSASIFCCRSHSFGMAPRTHRARFIARRGLLLRLPLIVSHAARGEYVTSSSETNAAGRPFFAFFPASIKEAYMRGALISASPAQVRI